ncbi:hypothetical protein NIES2100_00300 [Calothrix sp. NIES-2100]|uniref:hypothetical protein n=1 Tax=Calothrix sp. NIES-2100 TaxID=1954172 RepID=UPI000B5FEF28|nr:hypothetical protein NIES2100_00300 [Calothrix sp. NIES-2100]
MAILDQNKSNQNLKVEAKAENRPRTLGLPDATLLMALVLIAGFVRLGNVNEQDRSGFPNLASTSELTTNPSEFIGKTVTIRSTPVQKVNSSSFIINDQPRISKDSILVVNASGVAFNLPTNRNQKIEIRGQVRKLVIPEIERNFDLTLQEEDYAGYINKPAIIAQSINLVD